MPLLVSYLRQKIGSQRLLFKSFLLPAPGDLLELGVKVESWMRVLLTAGFYKEKADGSARSLRYLSRSLEKNNVELQVYSSRVEPLENSAIKVFEAPGLSVPGYRDYAVSLPSVSVWQKWKEFQPDLVHVSCPDFLGAMATRFARRMQIPLVISHHTDFISYADYYQMAWAKKYAWRCLRWFYNQADYVFVPSEAVKNELAERGFKNMKIWSRGSDLKDFSPLRRSPELRRKWTQNSEDQTFVIGYVGRLVWYKDVRIFGDLAKAFQDNKNLKFVMIGDGPAREELAKDYPSIHFEGLVEKAQVGDAIASLDLMLFPSRTETYGQVVSESIVSGVPVVVSDWGGPQEIVRKSMAGLVAQAGDLRSFQSALQHILDSNSEYKKLQQAALEFSSQAKADSWDKANQAVLDTYKQIISKTHATSDSLPK